MGVGGFCHSIVPLSIERAESSQTEAASGKQHFTDVLESKYKARVIYINMN